MMLLVMNFTALIGVSAAIYLRIANETAAIYICVDISEHKDESRIKARQRMVVIYGHLNRSIVDA